MSHWGFQYCASTEVQYEMWYLVGSVGCIHPRALPSLDPIESDRTASKIHTKKQRGLFGIKYGLLAMPDGSIGFIEPMLPRARAKLRRFASRVDDIHTLRKRDVGTAYQWRGYKCLHNFATPQRRDSRPNRLQAGPMKPEGFVSPIKGILTIQTALFVDGKIWRRFAKVYGEQSADKELLSFILATIHNVNALFRHPTIVPKVRIQIKKYEVLKRTPPELADHMHGYGEAELLLKAFCNYQERLNAPFDNDPRRWDHAILFTGHDIHSNGMKAVAGFAPVGGMCNPLKSCTINEGVDFGCVFVIAHEMGHSLGMTHDGDNGCNSQCCIMSPFVGDGKTSWSSCSVSEMNSFLRQLGNERSSKRCLVEDDADEYTVKRLDTTADQLPGQMYTVDQQCKLVHGKEWSHMLQSGQSPGDVCKMVWCSAGEGVIRNSHPALEGTYCGHMKWCLEGKCQMWRGHSMPVPVNGRWAEWKEQTDDQCSACKIERQLRVRISQRLCVNPPANNGGKECVGSEYRATVCSDAVCSGPSPNEYATAKCAKWQVTFPTILSGVGLQHNEQSCKIWCHVRSSDYAHAVGNFPDGTPCNGGGHCVRGRCMRFQCSNKRSLVASIDDCPQFLSTVRPAQPSTVRKGKVHTTKLRTTRRPSISAGNWTDWTAWGRCSRSGWKARFRKCKHGRVCAARFEKQRSRCQA